MTTDALLKEKLNLARRELLDMGLRANPLLSYRQGAKSLGVVEEASGQVFDILVSQKKAMRFLPLPDIYQQREVEKNESTGKKDVSNSSLQNTFLLDAPASESSIEEPETDEQPQEPLPPLAEYLRLQGDERLADTYLQTSLMPEKLDTTLLRIESEAHTLLQEQGVEVLYLALGFLTWYEDANSSTPRSAPLVLIPVELRRTSAREMFSIVWTEADLGPNLALAAKLRGEFKIDLPEFDEELNIKTYFKQVQKVIVSQARWEVKADDIALGLFSFGKFQMFTDLDPERWPSEKALTRHPVLTGLLGGGFANDAELIRDIDSHQHLREPEQLQFVKDADSSQTAAVLSVMEGANLVIQGPPGTGKSQTITNIISEGLARGKKILFVAQKMAALEVVKQRLDESHLGDAVLELHSHKSTKKAVLDSLKQTLEQGRPKTPDRKQEYSRLKEVRTQLNGYVETIKEPILNSDENYIQALGKHLQLKGKQQSQVLPEIRFSIMQNWDKETLTKATRVVESVAAHISEKGLPAENPFFASSRTSLSPLEQQQITELATACLNELESIRTQSRQLALEMGLVEAVTLNQVKVLHRAATRALDAPKLQGVKLNTDDWQQRRDSIRKLVAAGSSMKTIREKHQDRFIPQAFEADILSIRQGFAGRVDKWWRIFSGDYRKAKAAYRSLCKNALEGTAADWLNHTNDLLEYQEQNKHYCELNNLGETLFQAQWQQQESDWEVLGTLSEWLIRLYEEIGKGEVPEGITRFLEGCSQGGNSLFNGWQQKLDELASLVTGLVPHLQRLSEKIDLQTSHPLFQSESFDLSEMVNVLSLWQQADKLYDIARYNQLHKKLCELNLNDLAMWSTSWDKAPDDLKTTLLISYYGGLVNTAYNEHDAIRQFDRLTHERLLKEFVDIDQALFDYSKEKLVSDIYKQLPNKNAPGEMDIVRREMNKKRRHISIRRLIAEAGGVMQQIKPVFMMSPMSVATYLPQGQIEFDLVIFDEASQITAPDALGAIARAKQVVVVGDSKQMPPTNFFGRAVELDEEEADQSLTADVESILGLMSSKGVPEAMLRWHYRSRHHSLIAVSNAEFYNNQLMVFPSPGIHPHATGLKMNYLPDTEYDRGGSRTNKLEALRIAEAVMNHAQNKPHLSLGVVAFSTAQREAIMLEVERLRREHPETDSFFNHHSGDEFFIKNLENVQGDERDVIYISVGYGRTASGKVSQSFGPLNSKGGERRLNVLITRARMAMEVFCNFTGDDLRTRADSPVGLKSFKAFLKYAETGELEQSLETGKQADSPFETEVHRAIETLGYQVEPQVGCNGFYIDLAVRDQNKPGRYILAVECDGATYHSSASARDRDRIRQAVLEGLGWRFHRIWSTDWFRNAAGEIDRLKESIEQSMAYYKTFDTEERSNPAPKKKPVHQKPKAEILREESSEQGPVGLPGYKLTDINSLNISGFDSFEKIPSPRLDKAIRQVVATEGPIHLNMLSSRLSNAAGFSRAGAKIKRLIERHISTLENNGDLKSSGNFISAATVQEPTLRDWSQLDRNLRKIDFVSDSELEQAVQYTVRDAFSINPDECISASLSMIGFKRATGSAKTRMDEVIAGMISRNKLAQKNGRLRSRSYTNSTF